MAITSAQDGDWSLPATWEGGVVPAAPEDAIVAHNVVMDGNVDIGSTPASATDYAIDITSAGTLSVAEDVTLDLRGNMRQADNKICTFGAGVTINIKDATQAYALDVVTSAYGTGAFVFNGTEAKPITVISEAGQSGIKSAGANIGGQVRATWTNFQGFKYATQLWGMKLMGLTDSVVSFTNCRFDSCGYILLTGYQSGAGTTRPHAFTNCTFVNSLDALKNIETSNLDVDRPFSLDLTGCAFDKSIGGQTSSGTTVENCVFGLFPVHDIVSFEASSWNNFAMRYNYSGKDGRFRLLANTTVQNFYMSTTASNGTLFQAGSSGDNTPVSVSLGIVEGEPTSDSSGEVMPSNVPGAAVAVKNTIVLNQSGTNIASMVACELLQYASTTGGFDHCTLFRAGANVGHDPSPTPPGSLSAAKNSIVWGRDGDQTGFVVHDIQASGNSSPNVGAAADVDYNCIHNIAVPYQDLELSGGLPGQNDITADPQFVNDDVGLLQFSASIGGPSTFDECWAELAKLNDPDFNTSFTVANLLAFIRNGLAPQNPLLKDAGLDGVTIGAVEAPVGLIQSSVTGTNTAGSSTVEFNWTEVPPP